jgi:hypothetical protein
MPFGDPSSGASRGPLRSEPIALWLSPLQLVRCGPVRASAEHHTRANIYQLTVLGFALQGLFYFPLRRLRFDFNQTSAFYILVAAVVFHPEEPSQLPDSHPVE